MSAITAFESSEFKQLRIWKDDQNREYFRAIDVCYALKHSNPSQAVARLVDSNYVVQIDDGTNRAGKVNYLSEPGLYQLIFASKTLASKKFQKWVFEEVLPKLRASGGYIMPNATSDQVKALVLEHQNKLLQSACMIEYTSKQIWEKLEVEVLRISWIGEIAKTSLKSKGLPS